MPANPETAPFVVQTERGLSVFYKERFLYSKIDPQRRIIDVINSLDIPPHSLIVCFSPVLGYGLTELVKKLPPYSFLLTIECDKQLDVVFQNYADKVLFADKRFMHVCSSSLSSIFGQIKNGIDFKFKKIINIDGSAGAKLYEKFYSQVLFFIQEAVSRFWINHITLINFGRSYSKNIFKNCKYLIESRNIYTLKKASIKKPILIVGAGPSLDLSREFIFKHRKHFFILAVDAALPAIAHTTVPDAAVLLESQFWIQRSFIGLANSGIPVYADITANPNAVQALGGSVFFFFTEYAEQPFVQKLNQAGIFPVFMPMGSVGLTALQLALFLSGDNVPIFHTGLDFSWSTGYTHAKGSSQERSLSSSTGKLRPQYRPELIFPLGFIKLEGKSGETITLTPNLKNYAELYKQAFGKNERIYDLGKTGLPISENTICEKQVEKILSSLQFENAEKTEPLSAALKKLTAGFLNGEKETLLHLRNILTNQSCAQEDELVNILKRSSYLYTHFPDSIEPDFLSLNFLKRIRIELEYFLKILN